MSTLLRQQESEVISEIRRRGPVTTKDTAKLLRLKWHQANTILDQMAKAGLLIPWDTGRLTLYGLRK